MRGSVEVHRYLVERAIPHEFYRLEHPLRRVVDAPAVLDLDPEIVVGAELFEVAGGPVLAVTPASACASTDAIASVTGHRRVRPIAKARVTTYTGFIADWLPPVGHERPSRALIDGSLLDVDVLYAAGGDPGVMLIMRSVDLLRATAATPTSLAVAPESVAISDAVASAG